MNKYDYIFNNSNSEDSKEKEIILPSGYYVSQVVEMTKKTSKNNNEILITKFKVIEGSYSGIEYKYIRTIPKNNTSQKDKYLLDLFKAYINSIGLTSFDDMYKFIGKKYYINLSCNKGYYNIKIEGEA